MHVIYLKLNCEIYFCFISAIGYTNSIISCPLLIISFGLSLLLYVWIQIYQQSCSVTILSLHIFHFIPCLHKCQSDGRPKRMQILFYLIFNQHLSFSQLDIFLMTFPSQRSHFYSNIKPHP